MNVKHVCFIFFYNWVRFTHTHTHTTFTDCVCFIYNHIRFNAFNSDRSSLYFSITDLLLLCVLCPKAGFNDDGAIRPGSVLLSSIPRN